MPAPELIHVRTLVPHLLLHFVHVIKTVAKRSVNICRVIVGPRESISSGTRMARDAGLPTADIRRLRDPLLGGCGHEPNLSYPLLPAQPPAAVHPIAS